MKDSVLAAKNLYREDIKELAKDFFIDNNAGKRKVAEGVFNHTFDKLKSEVVAKAVFSAYERRRSGDESIDFVHMSTALMAAIILIRGDE